MSKFAPAEDRKGRALEPGDKVRFKTYPRGEAEGVVIVSSRSMQVMPDGSTLPALAIEVEGGRTFGMPSSKGVLKLTPEPALKTEDCWKDKKMKDKKMKLREAIRKIIKEELSESEEKTYTYVVSAKVNGYSQTCTVMASSINDAKDKGAEKLGVDSSTVRARKRDS